MTGETGNKHLTAREFVLEGIRDAMLDGRITAGQELDDQALAEEFGVSRTPVREALKVLEVQGFVMYRRRFSKPVVAPISADRIEEVYLMRIALEAVAVARVCDTGDSACLSRLERWAREGREALVQRDVEGWSRCNRGFHIGLAECSGLTLLSQEVASLVNLSTFYSRMVWNKLPGLFAEAGQEHEEIVEACRQKNSDVATRLIQDHLAASCRTQVKLARERESASVAGQPDEGPSRGQRGRRGRTAMVTAERRRTRAQS